MLSHVNSWLSSKDCKVGRDSVYQTYKSLLNTHFYFITQLTESKVPIFSLFFLCYQLKIYRLMHMFAMGGLIALGIARSGRQFCLIVGSLDML